MLAIVAGNAWRRRKVKKVRGASDAGTLIIIFLICCAIFGMVCLVTYVSHIEDFRVSFKFNPPFNDAECTVLQPFVDARINELSADAVFPVTPEYANRLNERLRACASARRYGFRLPETCGAVNRPQ